MNKQISLTVPEPLFAMAKAQAKKEGYRSVQEYLLQVLRDRHFYQNLPRYERIAKELDEGKGTTMTLEEFQAWSKKLRDQARKSSKR